MLAEVVALLIIAFAVMALQSWIFNRFTLSGLEYGCCFSVKEAHEGDSLYLVETVYNKKIIPVPWLKVDIHSSRWLDFAGTSSVIAQDDRRVTSSFFLRSYQRTVRRWKLRCLKRGVFTIENVTLVWGDILGIRTNSSAVCVNAVLVVYPEIIPLEDVFVQVNRVQGDTIVKRWIIDDPFIVSGAREYTPRDPMNRIHWPASARESRLMVRKNDFTSQLGLTVVLNMQSTELEHQDTVDREKIEFGIKVAATVLDRALRFGSPVRFAANGCTLEEEKGVIFTGLAAGREHVRGMLNILARLKLANYRDFEYFLEDIRDSVEHSDVIFITPYLSAKSSGIIRSFRRRGNTIKIMLTDRFVNSADLPGDIDIYILGR